MSTHIARPATQRTNVDDGPPQGGPLRARPKGTARHVAELDALVTPRTLSEIIDMSRATISNRLSLAKAEVLLNSWSSSAHR